jgi:hypothetical protein
LEHKTSKLLIFTLIPIILSIGITPAISFADHHKVMSPKQQTKDRVEPKDVVWFNFRPTVQIGWECDSIVHFYGPGNLLTNLSTINKKTTPLLCA